MVGASVMAAPTISAERSEAALRRLQGEFMASLQAPASAVTHFTARGVEKAFGRTQALAGANLELHGGEVHGLIGSNGAGKSTLSRVIAGHITPDAGELFWRGRPLITKSTRAALDSGIALVAQETNLALDMTVLENIFLPELGRPGKLSYRRLRQRAEEVLRRLGQENIFSLDTEVRRLSAAQRQLVEIAKALALEAALIIFDEPTASLSPVEVERLFDTMARLRDAGAALVFVSHRLEEVFAITDRVTVMREGRTVIASQGTASLSQNDLIRGMVGQEIVGIYGAHGAHRAVETPVIFEVQGVCAAPMVQDVSFTVRRGEILGLGGLVGAGRSEALEAIFGLRPRQSGRITLAGKPLDIRKPIHAIRAGIGFVAEDRRQQNIVPDLSVRENLLLAHLGAHRGFGLGYRQHEDRIDTITRQLGLPKERLADKNLLNFSGGMQQKIIIARWLLLEPKVLILDEPTKGVDIGTRSSIYAMLREIAAQGVAVVVVTSDFDELLGVAERVVVISDGISIADVPSRSLTEEKLTLLAAPRTSTARNVELLSQLAREHNGSGFWALIDENDLISLATVVGTPESAPGFAAGEAIAIVDTPIAAALQARGAETPCFYREPGGGRSTLMLPMTSRRGHDLGWLGLTLDRTDDLPDPLAIQSRIDSFVISA